MEKHGSLSGILRATIVKSLVAGFIVGSLFLGLMSNGRVSLWQEPGLFLMFGLLFSILSYPVLIIAFVFRGKGPFGTWPEWKVFDRRMGASGLPVVRWREGSLFLPPREVAVEQNHNGTWMLKFTRPKIMDTEGSTFGAWLAFGLFTPTIKGISRMIKEGGVVERQPWSALETLEVVPWRQRYGTVGPLTHRRRETSNVLVAHFSDGATIELSDWWWAPAAYADLKNMITQEFITGRPEHLKRIATAERMARNAEIGERKKVV